LSIPKLQIHNLVTFYVGGPLSLSVVESVLFPPQVLDEHTDLLRRSVCLVELVNISKYCPIRNELIWLQTLF